MRALKLVFSPMKNRNLRAPLAVLPLAMLAAFPSHAQTDAVAETVED